AAASSRPRFVGTGTSALTWATASSAYPPWPPVVVATRRPSQAGSTPSPTADTVPATPLPGTYGGLGPPDGQGARPPRTDVSTNVTDAAATSTTTSPPAGVGSGVSRATSTPGGPNSLTQTACMAVMITERFAPLSWCGDPHPYRGARPAGRGRRQRPAAAR